MVTPTSKPYISTESVRQMLQHMVNPGPSREKFSTLLGLVCVRLHILKRNLPAGDNTTWIALQDIVCSLVETRLSSILREDFANLSSENTFDAASKHINSVLMRYGEHPFCIEWLMLYLCYIRVELDITLDMFAELCNFTPRTARRYRIQAVDLLTTELTKEEERASTRYHSIVNISKLPYISDEKPFFGRSELTSHIITELSGNSTIKILISGPPGMGKSHFVQQTCQQYLTTSNIKNFVWINVKTATVEDVFDEICKQLMPPETLDINLRQILFLRETLIVIDDIQNLSNWQMANELLYALDAAQIVLISRRHMALGRLDKSIILDGLKTQEIIDLAMTYQPELMEKEGMQISSVAGGNPAAAILMAQNFLLHSTSNSYQKSIDQLLEALYNQLSAPAQILWILLALSPPSDGFSPQQLKDLWQREFEFDALNLLVEHHILTSSGDRVQLGVLCNIYICRQLEYNAHIQSMVHEILGDSLRRILQDDGAFSRQLLQYWSETTWGRRLASLYAGTASYERSQIEKPIEYDESQRYIQSLIDTGQKLGANGDFIGQSYLKLDLAIAYKRTGELHKAFQVFESVAQAGKRYKDAQLELKASLHIVKILIEIAETDQAHQILTKIAPLYAENSVENHLITMYQFLLCEIDLLKGDLAQAQDHLTEIELDFEDNYSRGLLYALKARILLDEMAYDHALEYLWLATHIFQESNDLVSLGRAMTNQVIVKHKMQMEQNEIKELEEIAQLQTTIKDEIGLLYTQHNIQVLRMQR